MRLRVRFITIVYGLIRDFRIRVTDHRMKRMIGSEEIHSSSLLLAGSLIGLSLFLTPLGNRTALSSGIYKSRSGSFPLWRPHKIIAPHYGITTMIGSNGLYGRSYRLGYNRKDPKLHLFQSIAYKCTMINKCPCC